MWWPGRFRGCGSPCNLLLLLLRFMRWLTRHPAVAPLWLGCPVVAPLWLGCPVVAPRYSQCCSAVVLWLSRVPPSVPAAKRHVFAANVSMSSPVSQPSRHGHRRVSVMKKLVGCLVPWLFRGCQMLVSVRLTGENIQHKRTLSCGPCGTCSKCVYVCVYVLTWCSLEKFKGQ